MNERRNVTKANGLREVVTAFVASVMLLLFSTRTSQAQELSDLAHLWAMGKANGSVQLLSNGVALKKEGGHNTFYSYHGGKFIPSSTVGGLSRSVLTWTYFDWNDLDYLDQVDKGTFDIPRESFLSRDSKVKKVIQIPDKNSETMTVLVCYTQPDHEQESPSSTAREIVILALKGQSAKAGYSYEKLWTKKLQEGSAYGGLVLQDISGIGRVLALYSAASSGASSEDRQLDLYLLSMEPTRPPSATKNSR